MNDSTALQLYRHVYKYFAALFLLVIIMISATFSVVYFPTINDDKNTLEALIKTKLQVQYYAVAADVRQQLEKILKAERAENFQTDQLLLIELWKNFLTIEHRSSSTLSHWVSDNRQHSLSVGRMSTNSIRNIRLNQQALEQSKKLIESIERELANETSNNLTLFISLKNQLNNIIAQLSILNIKTSPVIFELLSEQVKQFFVSGLPLNKKINKELNSGENIELNKRINTFEALMISEQRMLAKWRGHLRLALNYRENLAQQLQDLPYQYIAPKPSKNKTSQRSTLSSESFLLKLERVFSLSQYKNIFITVIGLSLTLFLYLLFLLRQRLKYHGEITIALVDELMYGQSFEKPVADSIESLYLQQQLSKITKPQHSDENYHHMEQAYQQQLTLLAETTGVAYWQYDKTHKKLTEQCINILLNERDIQVKNRQIKVTWRAYFSSKSVKKILAMAKAVKKSQASSEFYIETYAHESVRLFICFKEGNWFGTITDTKKNGQLSQKIVDLDNEIIRQNKAFHQKNNQKKQLLNEMIIQAMLQSQSHSCYEKTSVQAYQQLTKILEWVRQQQIVSRLEASGTTSNLIHLNLFDETYAAILNAMSEVKHFKNQITLSIDKNIRPKIKQDARLYQRLILATLKLLFSQKINAHCAFYLHLGDHNSHQQTIKFIAELTTKTSDKKDALLLENLLNNGSKIKNDTPDFIHFFLLMFSSLRGRNLTVVQTNKGYTLSYELQMETPEKQPVVTKPTGLTQKALTLAKNDDNYDFLVPYQITNVELLFAVNNPEKQLPLMRILQGFGLQLRVVSSAQAMLKHWKTGRYLILINEFEQSPFIEPIVGKSIQRGVFNFTGARNGILSDSQEQLSKNWLLGDIPTTLDVNLLSQLLAPWLKIKKVEAEPSFTDKVRGTKNINQRVPENKAAQDNVATIAVFDMAQYTLHQGGAEFAIYMLSDYLESNHEHLTKIVSAVEQKNINTAVQCTNALAKNAQILAAPALTQWCEALINALNEKNIPLAASLIGQGKDLILAIDHYVKTCIE